MPRSIKVPFVVLALLLALLPLRAFTEEAPVAPKPTEPGEILFVQGQERETAGDYEAACDIYKSVPQKYPDSPSAPSALFQCAFLMDERLHDVDRALPLYTEVIQRYPNSRASKKAEIRGGVIAPYAGKWAESYKAFQELLETKTKLPIDEFEERMMKLIDANPEYPGADQLLFFLARTAFRDRRVDACRKYYHAVIERYPGTLSAAFSYKGLGDLEFDQGNYSLSAAYYDAATVYAEKLDMPPPSPRQRRKAHLYVQRYQALLVSFLILGASALGFLYLWGEKPDWKPLTRRWAGTALSLLPLFGALYGVALYLLYQDDPSRAFNLTGSEPNYVIAAYALVCGVLLLSDMVWPSVLTKRHGKLVFWLSLPALLLSLNYCIFYWLDLVMYLESSFLGYSPLTGLPTN